MLTSCWLLGRKGGHSGPSVSGLPGTIGGRSGGGTALLGQPSQPSAPCLMVACATCSPGHLELHPRPPQTPVAQEDSRSCSYPFSPYAERGKGCTGHLRAAVADLLGQWVYTWHVRGQFNNVGLWPSFPKPALYSTVCSEVHFCHNPVKSHFTGEEMM